MVNFIRNNVEDSLNLESVVVRAQKGDRLAQGELVELLQNSLLRFCIRLCSRQELAEDLCQESFIRALSQLPQLKDPKAFRSWLFQSAKNVYFDYLKSPRNKPNKNVEDFELSGEDSDVDVAREVQRVLAELSADDRLLLILIDMEGYAYREAALMCSLPEANIPSRLHRIRLKFMDLYKK